MIRTSILGRALAVALAAIAPAASAHGSHEAAASLEMLTRTIVPIENSAPLDAATLVGTDGKPASAQLLRGHWTLLYFGYTSCPDVCPTTLATLARVARDPASGVADGRTRIVFVSVDPVHDTPQRLRTYLHAFDSRIVGLAGRRDAVRHFASAAGAGYGATQSGTDHSTSVFVLDISGRPVAALLRPSDPAHIVADFAQVRASHASTVAQRP
ncbi:MAG TPA: SCO family protein [Usitatibacter sp.]|nr:SCO family protein [Usitatibacter sp.]